MPACHQRGSTEPQYLDLPNLEKFVVGDRPALMDGSAHNNDASHFVHIGADSDLPERAGQQAAGDIARAAFDAAQVSVAAAKRPPERDENGEAVGDGLVLMDDMQVFSSAHTDDHDDAGCLLLAGTDKARGRTSSRRWCACNTHPKKNRKEAYRDKPTTHSVRAAAFAGRVDGAGGRDQGAVVEVQMTTCGAALMGIKRNLQKAASERL
ncbi:hypothetical protein GGX14DRAFT_577717 [Mycena pura]|uniref:Uncharacterized protein n=1 Tax=Mycena pura TaxID=153505 RepID=A0AAD6Y5X2_9AGAR|nr:hypothetical protein GGX14DRAFT_577717 [Mycena pura]